MRQKDSETIIANTAPHSRTGMQRGETGLEKPRNSRAALRQREQIDAKTGLTLPLSKSLDSQDLKKHRAMVAIELEVVSKKCDRFGWERDRGSAVQDRLIIDWMDALEDFPLPEIQTACRAWIKDNPRRMPNEGDIRGKIMAARRAHVAALPRRKPSHPERGERITAERAEEIMIEVGFRPKKFAPDSMTGK